MLKKPIQQPGSTAPTVCLVNDRASVGSGEGLIYIGEDLGSTDPIQQTNVQIAAPTFTVKGNKIGGNVNIFFIQSWEQVPGVMTEIDDKIKEAIEFNVLDEETAKKIQDELREVSGLAPKKDAPAVQGHLQTAYRIVTDCIKELQEQATTAEQAQNYSNARKFFAGAALLTVIAVDLLTTGGMITRLALELGAGHTTAYQQHQAGTCLACGAALPT